MISIENNKLENLFFSFCIAAEIKTFIDVGSNNPKNGNKFLGRGSNLNDKSLFYFAFEANPICFGYYYEIRESNFVFSNTAISDYNGFITIFLPDNDLGYSSNFIRKLDRKVFKHYYSNLNRYELANNLGGASERHINSSKKFTVQVVRLDTLMAEFKNKTVLWIDVEGSLPKVLNGCGSLLNSNNLVAAFVESEEPVFSKADWLELESHKLLTNAGFKLQFYSDAHNGLYIKPTYEFLLKKPINYFNDISIKPRRHTFLLRLKSLFFSGNNLMKNWQNN